MIDEETLFEISRLCGKPLTSVGQFDLSLLGFEPGMVASSVLDYFSSNVPETSISARSFSKRDICRIYKLKDLVDVNQNAVPNYYILEHGFMAFGSDLSGDAFTVDIENGYVYLVSHEEDWEELIANEAERLGGPKAVVSHYAEHMADSIEQFLDMLMLRLREVDHQERAFCERAMAEPNIENEDGNTLLIVCIHENDFETFRRIIELGANLECFSDQDRPAVGEAAVMGRLSMLRHLLELGVNPNSTNSKGETPLMMAARHSRLECAKLLIEFGADKTRQDKEKRTALDHMSRWREEPELISLLS